MTIQYREPEQNRGGIKSWREEERPREKLMSKGAAHLTLAELLAILINNGYEEKTALELARDMLTAVGHDLHVLAKWRLEDYTQFKGIGPAKAVTLMAVMELTRRRQMQKSEEKPIIKSSKEAYEVLWPLLGDLDHEQFWILCLNQANMLLTSYLISSGGITGTVVDCRILFRHAINTSSCVSLILAHNHPSGQLKPSMADRQLTAKIVRASKSLDIAVPDHIIVTQNAYYSFADEGIMPVGD